MSTALFTHDAARGHVNPDGHAEQVARYDVVSNALQDLILDRRVAPVADDADVLRCHPQRYLDAIRAAEPRQGLRMLDGDTSLSSGSLEAALRAVGGACAAVDAVLDKSAHNAFVAMRPPGHHAERETAMGFCLFGTVAIAAMRALDHHGLDRVAVLDFDVHHGNGTQDLLWDEGRALFVSSHQMPLYPGTGAASDRGAHGQILNMPLASQSDGTVARQAWQTALDRMRDWKPQLVVVSAGFDAHTCDPLAQLNWQDADFTVLTRMICQAAADCCAPVVSCLEGGYDLAALGRAVRTHVEVLMESRT